MRKRVITITGSRTINDRSIIERLINEINPIPGETTVRIGDAKGVDKIATEILRERQIKVETYIAWWDKLGFAAGPIRNLEMVTGSNEVWGLWDGESRGTRNCINEAMKQNIWTNLTIVATERKTSTPTLWETKN